MREIFTLMVLAPLLVLPLATFGLIVKSFFEAISEGEWGYALVFGAIILFFIGGIGLALTTPNILP